MSAHRGQRWFSLTTGLGEATPEQDGRSGAVGTNIISSWLLQVCQYGGGDEDSAAWKIEVTSK